MSIIIIIIIIITIISAPTDKATLNRSTINLFAKYVARQLNFLGPVPTSYCLYSAVLIVKKLTSKRTNELMRALFLAHAMLILYQ